MCKCKCNHNDFFSMFSKFLRGVVLVLALGMDVEAGKRAVFHDAVSLLLDLRVPVLYTGDVPCNGAGEPLVVRPAGRTLGLPRLAMAMASSSSAALWLAALRILSRVCTVDCLGQGCISSKSSVILDAPL